jgi:hypothetical protein
MFNDDFTELVSEDVVFRDANGGFDNRAANFVIYVNKEILETLEQQDFNSYQFGSGSHAYESYIPKHVLEKITEENKKHKNMDFELCD